MTLPGSSRPGNFVFFFLRRMQKLITGMWVERNPEELKRWVEASEREARTGGGLIAGLAWLGSSVLLAGGWFASARMAVLAQTNSGGSFWSRFPVFLLITLPFAYWIYGREKKRAFAAASSATICPKCETAGEGNEGSSCECGGTFSAQSKMKWAEEDQGK
jgi:hypothetical protein